ncbi:hypothetical protein ACLKA6_014544 [Drosophila palustris]
MATKRKRSTKKKCKTRNISARRQNAAFKAPKVGGVRSLDQLSSWELSRFQSALNAAANLNKKRRPKKASSKKYEAEDQMKDSPSSHHNPFFEGVELFLYMMNMKNSDDSSSSDSDDSLSESQEQSEAKGYLQEAKKLVSRCAREKRKN